MIRADDVTAYSFITNLILIYKDDRSWYDNVFDIW